MKKTQAKRQRIPRRGPGVAELEKILKEQEGGGGDGGAGQGHDSFITQFQDISPPPSLNPPRPPPPPPPPPLVPIITPPRDYASWSNNLPLFPPLEFIPPPLPTTAASSAKKPLFPTTRISDSQLNFPPHFFPSFQYSASSLNLEYCNSMVNINPGSASSYPSATSSAARYFRQIEHPSSQISTDFNNIWTSPEEQEKMVSAKRVRPFLEESHREGNVESRGPILTIMATKDSSPSSSSSMEMNPSPFHFDSNFRGTKRGFGGQLMSSIKRSSGSYQLAEDNNLMVLGSSSSSAPNEIAPFNFHLPQETMEASQHRDEGGCASDYYKVTFNSSFYESNSNSKGNKDITIGSKAGAGAEAEAEAEGIDLNLKL
ncbi:unnamed protein product [Citrullus colocynthis]|uniref:Uncharacterized protein n=1 Tax=Citrullus colocynthis TaxID=252529 RepID=A0ABP0Z851_9ROSI